MSNQERPKSFSVTFDEEFCELLVEAVATWSRMCDAVLAKTEGLPDLPREEVEKWRKCKERSKRFEELALNRIPPSVQRYLIDKKKDQHD